MDIFSALMAGSLFALACNLDTVLAAVGKGARGIPLGPRELFTAAGVTTAVTFLSLELGALGASFLPAGLAEKLGEKTGRRLEIEAERLSPNGRETIQAARMERIGSIAKQPATSIEEGLEKMISFYSNYVLLQKVIDEMDSL